MSLTSSTRRTLLHSDLIHRAQPSMGSTSGRRSRVMVVSQGEWSNSKRDSPSEDCWFSRHHNCGIVILSEHLLCSDAATKQVLRLRSGQFFIVEWKVGIEQGTAVPLPCALTATGAEPRLLHRSRRFLILHKRFPHEAGALVLGHEHG